jgi:hypothetical protein
MPQDTSPDDGADSRAPAHCRDGAGYGGLPAQPSSNKEKALRKVAAGGDVHQILPAHLDQLGTSVSPNRVTAIGAHRTGLVRLAALSEHLRASYPRGVRRPADWPRGS